MSGSVLNRLVWKEYRLLRGFWWAMLIAALLGQLYALWLFSSTPNYAQSIFLIGISLTACYALGCGATAFAGEREAGTYALQRVLPVTPPAVLLGKLLFATISTLALGVLLWLVATLLVYFRWDIGAGTYAGLALLGALKSIELLVWGVFFSLLLTKPLRAVVLAALTTAVVAYPLSWLLSDIPLGERTIFYFPSFVGDSATFIPRTIIVILVVGCDIYLARRWFGEPRSDGGIQDAREESLKNRARSLAARVHRNPQRQRLLWQTFVRVRWMLAIAALTYLFLLLSSISMTVGIAISETLQQQALLGILVPISGLMGMFVFADDQLRHQFRFFAEHGVSPHQVWWSRQRFWMGMLLLSLLVAIVAEITLDHLIIYRPDFWRDLGIFCVANILAYAAGQLCSQWIRSSIVAGPITVVLTIVLTAWSLLMFSLGVSLWGTVVPIPLVLLLATWANADDWIKESRQGRVRVRRTLLLAVPTLLVIVFAICFRWLQIPAVTLQFETAPHTAAQLLEEEEAGKRLPQLAVRFSMLGFPDGGSYSETGPYHRPHSLLDTPIPEPVSQWLIDHQDFVQTVEDCVRRERFRSPPHNASANRRLTEPLQKMMVFSARRCQKSGQLDKALEQYLTALWLMKWEQIDVVSVHDYWDDGHARQVLDHLRNWANESEQTPERIRRVVVSLQDIWSVSPPHEIGIESEYNRRMKELSMVADEEYDHPPYDSDDARGRSLIYWFFHLMPWERARIERLYKAIAAHELETIATSRKTIDKRLLIDTDRSEAEQLESWYETSANSASGFAIRRLAWLTADETIRRGTLLVLALEGWRLEHGQLPESLDMLVPDWLAELPLDPLTANSFSYCPNGAELYLQPYGANTGLWWGNTLDLNGKLKRASHVAHVSASYPDRYGADTVIVFPLSGDRP